MSVLACLLPLGEVNFGVISYILVDILATNRILKQIKLTKYIYWVFIEHLL